MDFLTNNCVMEFKRKGRQIEMKKYQNQNVECSIY